jgi:hypothetical protein
VQPWLVLNPALRKRQLRAQVSKSLRRLGQRSSVSIARTTAGPIHPITPKNVASMTRMGRLLQPLPRSPTRRSPTRSLGAAHLLLPPPLLRRRSPSLLTSRAQVVNWPIYHITKNCLPPDGNIMQDRVHPTLLEHVFFGWVDPHMVWSFPRLMFLSHTVDGSDVEPLQPCQCGLCEVPCLATIKEDRLHNCLLELGAEFWQSVVRLEDLPHLCPYPPSLLDLTPHCPDIVVVLGKDSSKVTEQLNFLQHFPFDVE